jgi:alkylation response protein AidB-like acyl-CoA dehydrogenase
VEASIFQEEAARAGAPMLASNLNSIIGNTLIVHAGDELRARVLPPTIRGETVFCLGYSEPGSGSDLASLSTRAARVRGGYVVSGSKMFTSLAHVADYMVCAAKTESEAPAHRAITVLLVPMEHVQVEPIWTLGGFRTNATFLDDVFVAQENVVGEVGGGWKVLMTALDFERAGTIRVGQAKRLLALACRSAEGLDEPERRSALGRLEAELLAAELLAYEVAWMQSLALAPTKESSLAKVAGTELVQRVADTALDWLGTRGLLARGAVDVAAGGELEEEYRNTMRFTVTAGTNEIQRNIIAQRGLGLPRS